MTVIIEARKPETSPRINLYTLDLSMYGEDNLNFFVGYNELQPDGAVYFNSVKYMPADIKVDGFEWNGKGQPATPKVSLSTINIDGSSNSMLLSLINDYNNLQGCKFKRIRTYKKYLDGESGELSLVKAFMEDIYVVDRKSTENKYVVEFELSSVLDQTGAVLPKNIITTSYCSWEYRRRNASNTGWVYPIGDNACPYTGSNMYDLDGVVTTNPLQDKPSKQFQTCCKVRYGNNAEYPFGGFAGAGRPTT